MYYTKTESNESYYNKTYIDTIIYTNTQSDKNYYNKNYIDNTLYLKTQVFNKTEINDKFLPFITAFSLQSGPYYYNLPTNTNGLIIWDGINELPKVNFKYNLSIFIRTWK